MDITPYETYRDIKIYVYEDMANGQKGVQFDWYGRLQEALTEDYEQSTLENKLRAARSAIDLLLTFKDKGLVGNDGAFKNEHN